MSRSGYGDYEGNGWSLIKWRGQVTSAIRGKRGQAFLRELLEALDAMPKKRLIAHDLKSDNGVCALGSIGLKRGLDLSLINPEDHDTLAQIFGVAHQLIREIEFENDEARGDDESPESRWISVRSWVAAQIRTDPV